MLGIAGSLKERGQKSERQRSATFVRNFGVPRRDGSFQDADQREEISCRKSKRQREEVRGIMETGAFLGVKKLGTRVDWNKG
jgi:hypothetical protein